MNEVSTYISLSPISSHHTITNCQVVIENHQSTGVILQNFIDVVFTILHSYDYVALDDRTTIKSFQNGMVIL